jgi:hypothetical protein
MGIVGVIGIILITASETSNVIKERERKRRR